MSILLDRGTLVAYSSHDVGHGITARHRELNDKEDLEEGADDSDETEAEERVAVEDTEEAAETRTCTTVGLAVAGGDNSGEDEVNTYTSFEFSLGEPGLAPARHCQEQMRLQPSEVCRGPSRLYCTLGYGWVIFNENDYARTSLAKGCLGALESISRTVIIPQNGGGSDGLAYKDVEEGSVTTSTSHHNVHVVANTFTHAADLPKTMLNL
ncbi:hypothetical protein CVT26_006915 [Gymnopilus dilepis]|uniref:Uncharacterized protein n=1 Tax=Gymnopilus dilepis TaxID=231916 RepID=A0A409W6B0_9AGAR|nr:hypothetical protein CVT26_006915 [Gymnopilus dilepis]